MNWLGAAETQSYLLCLAWLMEGIVPSPLEESMWTVSCIVVSFNKVQFSL